jgi:hypothetical protein
MFSKHNFIFVFVNECERVSFIKNQKRLHMQRCLVMGYEVYEFIKKQVTTKARHISC